MWHAGERTSYKTLVENVHVETAWEVYIKWEDNIKIDLGGTG